MYLQNLNISVEDLKASSKSGKLEIGHLYSNTVCQNCVGARNNEIDRLLLGEDNKKEKKLDHEQSIKSKKSSARKTIDYTKKESSTSTWTVPSITSESNHESQKVPKIKLKECEDINYVNNSTKLSVSHLFDPIAKFKSWFAVWKSWEPANIDDAQKHLQVLLFV